MNARAPIQDLSGLESALGHTFARPEILVEALTHRSQAYELAIEAASQTDDSPLHDNERLEFLGDAVLGLVVAEGLYAALPKLSEGELTRLRAELVSRRNMAEVGQKIDLGAWLLLGKGEERSGGRRKAALLANTMEAVIAAIFLDGGLEPVRHFTRQRILGPTVERLAHELRAGAPLGDHKSALQKHLQANHTGSAVYAIVSESGPDHRKRFQVELRLRELNGDLSEPIATGSGSTRKKAEQEAARKGLDQLATPTEGNEAAEEGAA